jgi:hypothetical protein
MGFGLAQWQRAQRAAGLFEAPRAAPKACPARSGHGGLWLVVHCDMRQNDIKTEQVCYQLQRAVHNHCRLLVFHAAHKQQTCNQHMVLTDQLTSMDLNTIRNAKQLGSYQLLLSACA